MKQRFPIYFYNPVTLTGAAIAIVSFSLILFMILLEATAVSYKPYVGIIAFVLLPACLIIGLVLIAIGSWRHRKRMKMIEGKEEILPRVDLNDPQHRRAFFVFSFGTLLLLVFSAFGSFKAYEYTDSDEFCGETCHKVMHPEYSAYELSPHARVGCVKCHIGPGADWFVRSKMSGAYQVYATIFNLYPRPIPTPIENLRPAQETCEQCHWPQQFFSEKRRSNTYYLTDEKNTSMELEMLMKIGGGNTEAGPTSGIHWHMNINNSVYYTTTDSLRQVIPFIEVISNDGSRRIYKSSESMPSDEELAKFEKRKMDCIDCHNRPSHIYHQPTNTVNHVMGQGWIDPSLPYIKKMSIEVLETPYMTTQNALDSIRLIIESYYQQDYPTIFKEKKNAIERSIKELQKIYTRNYFPIMNVSWKRFPNNIGHLFYPGCFRCHDGKHVSDDGIVLSKDCNSCHTILAQQFQNKQQQVSLDGLPYQHPEDVGNAWMESNCNDCHSSQ